MSAIFSGISFLLIWNLLFVDKLIKFIGTLIWIFSSLDELRKYNFINWTCCVKPLIEIGTWRCDSSSSSSSQFIKFAALESGDFQSSAAPSVDSLHALISHSSCSNINSDSMFVLKFLNGLTQTLEISESCTLRNLE